MQHISKGTTKSIIRITSDNRMAMNEKRQKHQWFLKVYIDEVRPGITITIKMRMLRKGKYFLPYMCHRSLIRWVHYRKKQNRFLNYLLEQINGLLWHKKSLSVVQILTASMRLSKRRIHLYHLKSLVERLPCKQ